MFFWTREAELRCSKADSKRPASFIGTLISFIGISGSSHILGGSLGPIGSRVVLLSNGLEDKCVTVDGETNIASSRLSTTLAWFSSKKSCR